MGTMTEQPSDAKPIALDGLGLLTNPVVFRAYAALYTGGVVSVWAFALLSGRPIWFAGTVVAFAFMSLPWEDYRHRLPSAARVDGFACLLAWLCAIPALVVEQMVVGKLTIVNTLTIPSAAGLAALGCYASLGLGIVRIWRWVRSAMRR